MDLKHSGAESCCMISNNSAIAGDGGSPHRDSDNGDDSPSGSLLLREGFHLLCSSVHSCHPFEDAEQESLRVLRRGGINIRVCLAFYQLALRIRFPSEKRCAKELHPFVQKKGVLRSAENMDLPSKRGGRHRIPLCFEDFPKIEARPLFQ